MKRVLHNQRQHPAAVKIGALWQLPRFVGGGAFGSQYGTCYKSDVDGSVGFPWIQGGNMTAVLHCVIPHRQHFRSMRHQKQNTAWRFDVNDLQILLSF